MCSLPIAPPERRSVVELQKCNKQKQELWLPEYLCSLYLPGCDHKISPNSTVGSWLWVLTQVFIPLVQKKQQQPSEPVSAMAHYTQIATLCSSADSWWMAFLNVFWAPVGATNFGWLSSRGRAGGKHPSFLTGLLWVPRLVATIAC